MHKVQEDIEGSRVHKHDIHRLFATRMQYPRHRAHFFPNTDRPGLVNNILMFFFSRSKHLAGFVHVAKPMFSLSLQFSMSSGFSHFPQK